MPNKFGHKLMPWQIFIRIKNDLSDRNHSFQYKYSVLQLSENDESVEWEREPARYMNFLKPESYQG